MAALKHPHIVPIFAVGIDHGVHYFAMQYIEGRSLAQVILESRREAEDPECLGHTFGLEGVEVARVGLQAAEAIEHAHAMGILHRDIKPANMLLDDRGNLWLVDFGLARFQSESDLTLSGDVLGTIRYMSPEQALGRGVTDARSDVYSLGVTLYELVAGRPALDGGDRQQLMHQIADREPVNLRKLNRRVPADLETIIQKAAAKEPGDRYSSASELAEDLRRFLNRQPIMARRPGPVEHASRWVERHKAAVGAAAAVLVLTLIGLVLGLVILTTEQRRTKGNLDLALRALDRSLQLGERDLERAPITPAVQESLSEALRLYERLAAQNPQDRQARLAGAKAYARVGDIKAGLCELDSAEEAYRAADAMLKGLLALDPQSAVYRDERAELMSHWGTTISSPRMTRQFQGSLQAEKPLRTAIEIDRSLLAEFPATARYQHRFVQDALRLSAVFFIPRWLPERKQSLPRRLPEMEQVLSEARDVLQQITPSSNGDRLALIVAHKHLGDMMHATGRSDLGARAYDMSLELLETLPPETGSDPAYHRACVDLLEQVCQNSFCLTDQPKKEEEFYARALPAWDRLMTRLELTPVEQMKVAEEYFDVGSVLGRGERIQAAVGPLSRAVQLAAGLVRQYPLEPEYRRKSSAYNQQLGHHLLAAGRPRDALPCLDLALELEPSSRTLKEIIAWDLVFYPNPAPEKAVKLAETLVKDKPDQASYWSRLGQAQVRFGDWAGGRKSLEKVIAMADGGDADDWLFLSMACWQLGDRSSARRWYDQAATKVDRTRDRPDPAINQLLAETARLIGVHASAARPN